MNAATSVTVNGSAAERYADGTYARAGLTLSNGTNTFTAVGTDASGRGDTNIASVYLPSTNTFAYDYNGNLVTNTTRKFEYDDENQLTRVTEPGAWKAEFVYDGKLRMRVSRDFEWRNGAWVLPMSPEDEKAFGYLKSMTAKEELTTFLALRGHCLMAMGRLNDGVTMHEQALRYSPDSRQQQVILAAAREHAQPQRAAFDYLPPEQRPNWPQPRRVNFQQRNVSGLNSVIPADPNPLNRIRNP